MFSLILIAFSVSFLFLFVPVYASCIAEAEISNKFSKFIKDVFWTSFVCFTLLILFYLGISMYLENYPESKSFYEFVVKFPVSFSFPALVFSIVSLAFVAFYEEGEKINKKRKILLEKGNSESNLKYSEQVKDVWNSWISGSKENEKENLSNQAKTKTTSIWSFFILLSFILFVASLTLTKF